MPREILPVGFATPRVLPGGRLRVKRGPESAKKALATSISVPKPLRFLAPRSSGIISRSHFAGLANQPVDVICATFAVGLAPVVNGLELVPLALWL